MITVYFDEFLPCLKEVETGEIYDTEVVRIKRKSFLSKFNYNTGWYVDWAGFDNDVEVYALVLKGTNNIQGMIAVRPNDEMKALEVLWACAAPENNVWRYGKKKFSGVGGHLFAIAGDVSIQKGYEGFLVGEAMDQALYEYYIKSYYAAPLPAIKNNPFRIMFSDKSVRAIMEEYNYEWTDSVI